MINSAFMKSIALLFCSAALLCTSLNAREVKPGLPERTIDLKLGLNADKPKYIMRDRAGKSLCFGYAQFNHKLNNYLDTATSVHGSFLPYYFTIGIDDISNNSEHSDVISGMHIILPQRVYAGAGDSLDLRMYGWHYTMSWFGFDLIKGETVTLAIGPSWSYGNVKMRRVVNGEKSKYKNPFVAPGARAEFRLTFGNFMIGGRATYRYDLTHGLWKRRSDFMPVMPEYKNTGLAYFGYIGLIF